MLILVSLPGALPLCKAVSCNKILVHRQNIGISQNPGIKNRPQAVWLKVYSGYSVCPFQAKGIAPQRNFLFPLAKWISFLNIFAWTIWFHLTRFDSHYPNSMCFLSFCCQKAIKVCYQPGKNAVFRIRIMPVIHKMCKDCLPKFIVFPIW